MQIFFLSCLFGVGSAMGIWVILSAQATVDDIVRHGGRPFPPGEP
jgi:hypothetical protein